jgi:6-pyruvoyl-tetrahydropterin synthase
MAIRTVTRRLEWDAGHRVLGHGGKCQFMHGLDG